jgi:restriction system protein
MFGDGPVANGPIAYLSEEFPAITLKAVVIEFGEKTDDGHTIIALREPWLDLARMFLRNPDSLYEIGWREFEEMIAGAWEISGKFDKVELTPRSGDKGRDVIGTKWGRYSIRIFDQAKAYKPGNLVTEAEVREMVGVLSLEPNVSKGYITTTSDFAPGVWKDEQIKSLMPNRLQLITRGEALSWFKELSGFTG